MDTSEHDHGSGDKEALKPGDRLLQDPLALAAMLHQAQQRESFLASLHPVVRRRVNALRKLQAEAVNIEAEFYQKIHEIECEYAERFLPLNDKRNKIVNGVYEPTDDECKFSVASDACELAEELKTKADLQNGPEAEVENTKGVSDFWLTTFRNVDIIAEMIQDHDEYVLKYLTDVEVKTSKDPMMFTFYFHFAPNEYFSNSVLTKEYSLKCQPDTEAIFEFDGPEISSCKGCKIDWKAGKNVTVKLIKKKQKHKQKGSTRFVTKEVKNDSFFNFFEPPPVPEEGESAMDDETRELLNADFEIGQILRDRVIPRAVLYYTGEACEDDEYDEDEMDEEDEDMDDEESVDDDDDNCPKSNKKEKPQECKQQ